MSIQLYGQWEGHTSIPNVSRAIARELKRSHLKFTAWGHGAIIPKYEDCPWPVALNSLAHVGVFIGYPPGAPNWLRGHKVKCLITVCETNVIPPEWVEACSQMDYVFVPSRFCLQVFVDSGVKKPKVIVLPHGVMDYGRLELPPLRTNEPLRLLHISGAASFPHRKGTPALLQAWANLKKQGLVGGGLTLTLKMYPDPRMIKYIKQLGLVPMKDGQGDHIIDVSPSLNPVEMATYLRGFDGVIQPSRGEGFGIVPLEARCLGVPVIATAISGHSEHFAPGVDIEVPVGPYKPLVTQANPDGFAPTVEPEAIEGAIKNFLEDLDNHRKRVKLWQERFGSRWHWRNVLKPLINVLKPLAKRASRTIRLGDSLGLRGL